MSDFFPLFFALFRCKSLWRKLLKRRLKESKLWQEVRGQGQDEVARRYVRGVAQVFANDQHVAYEGCMSRGVAVLCT